MLVFVIGLVFVFYVNAYGLKTVRRKNETNEVYRGEIYEHRGHRFQVRIINRCMILCVLELSRFSSGCAAFLGLHISRTFIN